ncbi:MAG: capsular biosynthesis protein [Flavobacteriia bacterium]|jgi:tyrosine-protein phosphatase YwqE|nr:capsular biosynthesis protein [Flavobacteriia bacterium]NBX38310.1 capsular biosynthesis protein [Flavobacteriia bacterium]
MAWFSKLFSQDKTAAIPESLNLKAFRCDMHNHFLPGVDDGSKSMEESLELLRKMEDLGYAKCIITPHIKLDIYPNSEANLQQVFGELEEAKQRAGIGLEIALGAEYFLDDSFVERIQRKELLCFGKQRYVLMEFSFTTPPVFEEAVFKRLQDRGYTPILAHFERYIYLLNSPEYAEKYRKMGVNIQMNLMSLTGHYGPEIRKQAEKMVDDCLFDFVGTDAHRIQHLQLLEAHVNEPYFVELGKRLVKNQGL